MTRRVFLHSRSTLGGISRRCVGVAAVCVVGVVLAGCVSVPAEPLTVASEADWWGALPEDATFYVYGRIRTHIDLLKSLLVRAKLGENETQVLLDNTTKFVAAAKLNGESKPYFSAVAFGTYSAAFMGIQMDLSADWSALQNPHRHWEHVDSGVKIAFPYDNMILLTNNDMEYLYAHIKEPKADFVPLDLAYEMRLYDVVLFFPRLPDELLPGSASSMNIPVDRLWFTLENGSDVYAIEAVFHLPSDRQAKAFLLAAKLVLMSWLKEAGIENLAQRLRPIRFVVEGAVVRMTELELPTQEFTEKSVAFVGQWLHEHINGGAGN